MEQKLLVLKLIEQNKTKLFDKFDANLTQEVKRKSWEELFYESAEKFGFRPAPTGKNYEHLWKVTWDNWKRAALSKKDKISRCACTVWRYGGGSASA